MNEIAFPKKPLEADIWCRTLENIPRVANTSLGKFLTVTCRQDPRRPRKKLLTKSLFRKSPSRPIYRASNSKKNSQSR